MLTQFMKKNLSTYKYSSRDTSPLANAVMHPFWDWVAQWYPLWLAPNLLTFVGFLLTVIHYLILSYYDPYFDNPHDVPRCVWLFIALMVFAAHTFDGTDGKQARRTKSSTALGEIFDHGCDSWSILFIPSVFFTLCGCNSTPWRMFIIQWILLWSFLGSQWEKYITGVLFLPWSFDIGQLSVIFSCLWVYFHGPGIFAQPLISGFTVTNVLEYTFFLCCFLLNVGFTVHNLRADCPQGTPWHRGRGHLGAFRPFIPMVVLTMASFCWVYFSPSDLVNRQPRLFLYCFSTITSNLCCELIFCQLCKLQAPVYNSLVSIYTIVAVCVAVNRAAPWISRVEMPCLVVLSVAVTIAHLLYACRLASDIADALNVPIFRIRRSA